MNHFVTRICIKSGDTKGQAILRRSLISDPQIGIDNIRNSKNKYGPELELHSSVKSGLEDFSRALSRVVSQTSVASSFFIIREKKNLS